MMEELISKKKLLADLKGIKEVLAAQGDPFLANIIHRAIQCVENQPVVAQPKIEVFLRSTGDGRDLEEAIRELEAELRKSEICQP